VIYAVPGQGICADETVSALLQAGVEMEIVPGVDETLSRLPLRQETAAIARDGYATVACSQLKGFRPNTARPLLVTQLDTPLEAAQAKLFLTPFYGDEHEVIVVLPKECRSLPLFELDRQKNYDCRSFVLVPPLKSGENGYDFYDLVTILEKLRAPGGCPWDREQTHETLRPCLLEETYEVQEAIDADNMDSLYDELGDVLLQVVFHAQIGAEHAEFNIHDVTTAICEKMIRRHPHVFARRDDIHNAQDVVTAWDEIKKQEKGQRDDAAVLKEVCQAFPAGLLAEKTLKKAAKIGFCWDKEQEVWEKFIEESGELSQALAGQGSVEEEWGDAFFALVNVARCRGINPEIAGRAAVRKFLLRFERMCLQVGDVAHTSKEELLRAWQKVKDTEFTSP
ncbi:MAG: nucleoside triphosphate pyrophosphohydrolase, partial [Eubacteriales bacterium]|nr:nucleoside triphosphate pyrophosphohydrolase [Eubacteriales bacterium]